MQFAIVEDDKAISEGLCAIVRDLGHTPNPFGTARSFLTAMRRDTFDMVLLDWHLPDGIGLDILKQLRAVTGPHIPVLFITANTDEGAVVEGLMAGADDYVTKPAAPPVVKARILALLRRTYAPAASVEAETYGVYSFSPAVEQARVGGEAAELTAKEFQLALLLFRNSSRALSRAYLTEAIWGRAADVSSRTLDVHLSHVRRKLGLGPANGYRLMTVYGYGYRLEPSLDD